MPIYTANFTWFLSARSYACYVGVAPFARNSGTSKHSSPGISKIANK
ncbi:MAG: IS110 family transposase [Tannerellaceae bacterium]|nr:IS110 family transposase [Tannerellaceae bacterium]